jgi:hypothetical protein
MILKSADDKNAQIQQLEALIAVAPVEHKSKIEQELRNLRAGIKGEQEATYLINFDLEKSQNSVVIHDLRLEINGRVAQIDHLLIHRTLNVFVLETKHLHAGMRITETGEFESWNAFKKCYEGMASPFAQNERHIAVLKEAIERIDMPSKVGLRLSPVYHSYVLVSPKSRIDRPKKFDTSHVIKADMIGKTIDDTFEKAGVLDVFGGLARFMSNEALVKAGQTLLRMHRPASFDYAARFGIQAQQQAPLSQSVVQTAPPVIQESPAQQPQQVCRDCKSPNLSVQYGKFGYYFKCGNCDANTPLKINCGKDGHKERIRKDGLKFYRECADCGTSSLYFTNKS